MRFSKLSAICPILIVVVALLVGGMANAAVNDKGIFLGRSAEMSRTLKLKGDQKKKISVQQKAFSTEVQAWRKKNAAEHRNLERAALAARAKRNVAQVAQIELAKDNLEAEFDDIVKKHEDAIKELLSVEQQARWYANEIFKTVSRYLGRQRLNPRQADEVRLRVIKAGNQLAQTPDVDSEIIELRADEVLAGIKNEVLNASQRRVLDAFAGVKDDDDDDGRDDDDDNGKDDDDDNGKDDDDDNGKDDDDDGKKKKKGDDDDD